MPLNIATLAGDGIGPEVVAQALRVLDVAARLDHFKFNITALPYGGAHYLKTGEVLTDAQVADMRKFDAVFLGAVGTPQVKPGILEKRSAPEAALRARSLYQPPPQLTDEKSALYQRYLQHQHPDSPQAQDPQGLRDFLYESIVTTAEVNYLKDDRIVAVSILDVCDQSVSSVYHFFDPAESRRSLGVFSVLAEIELTRQRGIPYYYMGYWVKDSATMHYKANYRPHELLVDGVWRRVE